VEKPENKMDIIQGCLLFTVQNTYCC